MYLPRVFLCLSALLIAASLVESLLLFWPEESASNSHYSFELRASDGEKIARTSGDLLLALDPASGYINLPNQIRPEFEIDRHGFRESSSLALDPKKLRIFLVGGSAAFGTGLLTSADALDSKIENLLAGSTVVNAAVIGHTSGHELSHVLHHILDFSPDLVIALNGWNDSVLSANLAEPRYGYGYGSALRQVEDRLKSYYQVNGASAFARIVGSLGIVLFPEIGARLSMLTEPTENVDLTRAVLRASLAYARNMEKLNKILVAYDATLLVALQPDWRVIDLAKYGTASWEADYYNGFRAAAKKELRTAEINFLDLNDFPESFSREMFMDAIHLNGAGYEAIAKHVTSHPILKEAAIAHAKLTQG